MTPTGYDEDFYTWLKEQAALIRAGRFTELDAGNLAEEVEALARQEKRELGAHIASLIAHLLIYARVGGYTPRSIICDKRLRLRYMLKDSPSLTAEKPDIGGVIYELARSKAARKTGLAKEDFPRVCPWDYAQLLNGDYFPEAPTATE